MIVYLRAEHSEGWYAARLGDPAYALWIAEGPLGALVGYALLGPTALSGAQPGDIELKRIHMLSRSHGPPLAGGGRLEGDVASTAVGAKR